MVQKFSKTNIMSKLRKQAGSIMRGTRERRFIGYSSWTGIPVAVLVDGQRRVTSPCAPPDGHGYTFTDCLT